MTAYLSPTIPLTILVEGLVLWLWCRAKCENFNRLLLALTLANLLTQVALITALLFSPFPYWQTLLVMEAVIVLVEGAVLRTSGISLQQAFALSLLVNAASLGLGLLLPL